MTTTAAALRALHRIHRQLSDLRDRLSRGPKQIAARETNLARLEAVSAQTQADAKAARMAVDQKQLQLKTGETKIEDLKRKLNTCESNREFQILKGQIAADQMANSVLEDEILDGLQKVEDFQATLAAAAQNVAKAKDDLTHARQSVQQEEDRLRHEIGRLESELKVAEGALPADVRADYLRIVRSKGAAGMAQVDGGICGGCFHQITTNMTNDLRLGRVVFCNTCGCLLYLPEDTSPGAA